MNIMPKVAVFPLLALLLGLLAGCGKKEKAQGGSESDRPLAETQTQPKSASGQQKSASKAQPPTSVVQRPAKQQQAIESLLKLYATVLVDPTKPEQPVVKVILKKSAGNTIRGTDLEHLSALDTIEELDLQGTSITDISHVAALKRLRVFSTPPLSPDQLGVLASLPSLQSLSCVIKKPEISRSTDSSIPVKDRRKTTLEANEQDFVQQALATLSQAKNLRNLRGSRPISAGFGIPGTGRIPLLMGPWMPPSNSRTT
jgi:hypothetical protein